MTKNLKIKQEIHQRLLRQLGMSLFTILRTFLLWGIFSSFPLSITHFPSLIMRLNLDTF